MTEPVADETRSILDGHIILSRELAAAAHYPAIDVLRSASRVINQITTSEHRRATEKIRNWMATYEKSELLIRLGGISTRHRSRYRYGDKQTTGHS